MIGASPSFQRMRNAARLVAGTDVGVLLCGEPGSGRQTLAREVHAHSPRCGAAFVPFHCAGAPAGALAEALGAASLGPDVDAAEAQAGSTLYLDEVGELTAPDQARLLHAMAAADHHGRARAPRVIAASALDLGAAVGDGRFRRDLYLRLCVVPIEVPPLRERVLDIPALIAHFLAAAAARHGLVQCRLTAGAERLFRRYDWPGNLRELANLCERLVILLPGGDVAPQDLPPELVSGEPPPSATDGFRLPPQGIDLQGLERELIRQALALAGGNKSRAARLLGLTRDTLLYRLQKHLIPG
ncbi:MAG TPA: sigma 54-interacting transcriptional regulator [Lamprocystis sp. (in: g-proteobacteria)]|nr:sigma 54-interacting transcriptional regulator [Lamprocystis sp. (in: g-proteobacteria)]